MFYGDTVQDTRQMFYSSWNKYQQKQLLLPLEQQIVDVIIAHPEYHPFFASPSFNEEAHFSAMGQNNPFLHMGLHLAIRDQISTDRPVGIRQIYQKLLQKYGDSLMVEHHMMDFLAKALWKAQNSIHPPDEKEYLIDLSSLFSC